jgi:hypothetical protein
MTVMALLKRPEKAAALGVEVLQGPLSGMMDYSGGKPAQNQRSRAGTNPRDRLFPQRTRRGIATIFWRRS